MNRKACLQIARWVDKGEYQKIVDFLVELPERNKRGTWGYYSNKLIPFLEDPDIPAPFSIFREGNSKLPFFSFSNLPLINCPGKGECAKWCYSLKAWRYPSAFFRQIQNTILVRRQSWQLMEAWENIPHGRDVRLYVDGDFESLETMEFWFDLLTERPDLKVYGYSKSWELFLEFDKNHEIPENYVLNLSSGSKYKTGPIRAAMMNLKNVRGEFVAVEAGKKPDAKTVRQAAKAFGMKKVFVCPGKCGSCLKVKGKNVHACGSQLLKDTTIVIGTH